MSDLIARLRTMSATGWHPIGDEAADEINRLTRERDAMAKDAARYRFLRTKHVVETTNDGELCIHYACDFEHYNDPDASIDAQIEQERSK